MHSALQLDGVVALSVPGLREASEAGFRAVARCTEGDGSSGVETRLPDGTVRRSFGTRKRGLNAEPLDECVRFETAPMRALVDAAVHQFLVLLQPLQSGPAALLGMEERVYPSLSTVGDASEQLEHFHAYRASDGDASNADAVPLHTDAGLFIALVPALYVPDSVEVSITRETFGSEPGFFVQRWDGSRIGVSPSTAAGCVVFLIGEGMQCVLKAYHGSGHHSARRGRWGVCPASLPSWPWGLCPHSPPDVESGIRVDSYLSYVPYVCHTCARLDSLDQPPAQHRAPCCAVRHTMMQASGPSGTSYSLIRS